MDIKPASDSDNESSDGDYIPEDDEDDEFDEGYLDADAFTDVDEFDEFDGHMDLVPDLVGLGQFADVENELGVDSEVDLWGDHEDAENLGLSDGYESESVSEGDLVASSDDERVVNEGKSPSSVHLYIKLIHCSSSSIHRRRISKHWSRT